MTTQGRGLSPDSIITFVQNVIGRVAALNPRYLRMLAYLFCILYGVLAPFGHYVGYAILAILPVAFFEVTQWVRDEAFEVLADEAITSHQQVHALVAELRLRHAELDERRMEHLTFNQVTDVAKRMQTRHRAIIGLIRAAENGQRTTVTVDELRQALNS